MASGINVQDLEGKKEQEEGKPLEPRDFFWDSLALYVISVVVGLSVLDAVAEFVRGSDVECFLPEGAFNDRVPREYVNTFCSGSLPRAQYFPVFIIITGAVIAVPHYLWLNSYRGNFQFFFSEVTKLDRMVDVQTAQHTQNSIQVVKRLTVAFATYKQSTIFLFYVVKLLAQWIFTAASVAFTYVFFRADFNTGFRCPMNNSTTDFWPFEPEQAFCVYNTLVVISYLQIAYVVLVCVLLICLSWALFFCFCTHATELGHRDVAKFTYLTGLPSKYYVAHLPIPGWSCCRFLRMCLLKCVTTVPWFTIRGGPRIRSDLDFLVLKLYRTDSGLAHTFKDVQVNMVLKDLLDDDQKRLHVHYLKHTDFTEVMPEISRRRRDVSDEYLKWQFSKEAMAQGIYEEYKQISWKSKLMIPDTLFGAILGYAAFAPLPKSPDEPETEENCIYSSYPSIMNAISINFDSVGYATSLARTFNWVGSVNFSSSFDPNADSPATCTTFYTNMTSLVLNADVLSADIATQIKIEEPLRHLWFPTSDSGKAFETSFIVVGPVPNDDPGHITTVDLFLDEIAECLGEDAVLLTLTPETINDKNVRNQFSEYIPRQSRFEDLALIVEKTSDTLEWPARESMKPVEQEPRASPEPSGGAESAAAKTEETAFVEMESAGAKNVRKRSSPQPKAKQEYTHHLKCGPTKVRMKFATYRYTGFNYRERREVFRPRKTEAQSNNVAPPAEGETEGEGADLTTQDGLRQRKNE